MNIFVHGVPGDQGGCALFCSHKIEQQKAQHDRAHGPRYESSDRNGDRSSDTAGMRTRGKALAHDGLRNENARSAVKNCFEKGGLTPHCDSKGVTVARPHRIFTGFPLFLMSARVIFRRAVSTVPYGDERREHDTVSDACSCPQNVARVSIQKPLRHGPQNECHT